MILYIRGVDLQPGDHLINFVGDWCTTVDELGLRMIGRENRHPDGVHKYWDEYPGFTTVESNGIGSFKVFLEKFYTVERGLAHDNI